ncbi:putative S-layer protein [archaeon]|nr:putative S-layer protein [archaeon]
MKAKIFTLILMTAILSVAFVSAASLDISNVVAPTSVNHDDGSFVITFDLENTGVEADLTWSNTLNNGASVSFSHNYIDATTTLPITATVTFPSYKNLNFAGTITATPSGQGGSESLTIPTVSINEAKSLTVTDTTINPSDTTVIIVVENTGNVDFTGVLVELEEVEGIDFTVNSKTISSLAAGASEAVEFDVTIDKDDLEVGTNDVSVTVTAGTTTAIGKISVERTYCLVGEMGGMLEIDKLKFTNNGIGDKDEWYLTDEIEVEVRIENTDSDDDVDDIVVEWGLYDKESGDFIIEEEENEFNLDDDERETLTFKFVLDPEEFDEDYNENDFVFYIKAWSDDNNFGEDVECTEEIETDIAIMRDDNFVIVDDIDLTSDVLPCGEELSGDFVVWNVGEEEEEDVFVMITNEELGINEKVNVGDMDTLEDVKRSFSIMVPEDASEKNYFLKFTVYDEDGDVFENNDDDESVFSKLISVEGQCSDSRAKVQITAINDVSTPDAVAGEKYIIKATLINNDDEKAIYTVSVFGNSAWSSLSSVDPQVVTIEAGESKEVSIALDIDSDVEGDKELTIKAVSSEGEAEQKVALSIESNEAEFDAFSGHVKNNWFIYIIVLVNIVLIIAIILVIRSMVRPREVYE